MSYLEQDPDKNVVPLYRSIKQLIWRQIRSGELLVGDKLPSENELTAKLGVSRITIRRALRDLEEDGVIRRVKGLGAFVTKPTKRLFTLQFPDIGDYIAAKGLHHEKDILVFEEIAPNEVLKKHLNLSNQQTVYHLSILQKANGVAIAHEDRFVVSHLFPDFIEQNFEQTSLIDYFLKRAVLERVEHNISAIAATAPFTKYLDIAENSPCLYLQRTTFSFGSAATFTKITLPNDRFTWESKIDLSW